MKEIWKDIKGYEGLYKISNYGRCVNINTKKLMKPNNSFKYLRYALSNHGKKENLMIHRIVAEAFIENPLNLETVNHIDEDKINNAVTNLEWCTAVDNSRKYYYKNENQMVGKYDLEGNLIDMHETAKAAGRSIDKSHSAITLCLNGIRKTAYGYVWRYLDVTPVVTHGINR